MLSVINSLLTPVQCTSCGDLFEGSKNREPSADDCIENMARDESCDNFSCQWHV